mmetsp:Transcript_17779/g.37114  ORF Transcript_17779/g.37114 Transcript_17779/m.37114 type:complete len:299 (-) Transcript_17779:377-1273(-)
MNTINEMTEERNPLLVEEDRKNTTTLTLEELLATPNSLTNNIFSFEHELERERDEDDNDNNEEQQHAIPRQQQQQQQHAIATPPPPPPTTTTINDDGIQKPEVTLEGGYFYTKRIKHLINTTLPMTSDRDLAWLHSHNKRRKYWHAYYNTSYVPLLWSESLKADAQVWANTLLDSCGKGMHHDPKRRYGENAAGNTGSGSWGKRREPEKIVARFVDYEVDLEWPSNGHLVQALWRASKYVGCAESHKFMNGKKQCHTQVCRYARTGNCNMKKFKNEDGTVDWRSSMLEDVSCFNFILS